MERHETVCSVLSTVKWLTSILKTLLRTMLYRATGNCCSDRTSLSGGTSSFTSDRCSSQTTVKHRSSASDQTTDDAGKSRRFNSGKKSSGEGNIPIEPRPSSEDSRRSQLVRRQQQHFVDASSSTKTKCNLKSTISKCDKLVNIKINSNKIKSKNCSVNNSVKPKSSADNKTSPIETNCTVALVELPDVVENTTGSRTSNSTSPNVDITIRSRRKRSKKKKAARCDSQSRDVTDVVDHCVSDEQLPTLHDVDAGDIIALPSATERFENSDCWHDNADGGSVGQHCHQFQQYSDAPVAAANVDSCRCSNLSVTNVLATSSQTSSAMQSITSCSHCRRNVSTTDRCNRHDVSVSQNSSTGPKQRLMMTSDVKSPSTVYAGIVDTSLGTTNGSVETILDQTTTKTTSLAEQGIDSCVSGLQVLATNGQRPKDYKVNHVKRKPFNANATRVFLYNAFQEAVTLSKNRYNHRTVVVYSDGFPN